jgi:hypothetical protein
MSYLEGPFSPYNINNAAYVPPDNEYGERIDSNKTEKENLFTECLEKIHNNSLIVVHYKHLYLSRTCYAIGILNKTDKKFNLTNVTLINESNDHSSIEIGDTDTVRAFIKYDNIFELYVKQINSDKDILNLQPTNIHHITNRWLPYMNVRIDIMRDNLNIDSQNNIFDSENYYKIVYFEPRQHAEPTHKKDDDKSGRVIKSSTSRVGRKHKGGKKTKKSQKQRKSRKNKSKFSANSRVL